MTIIRSTSGFLLLCLALLALSSTAEAQDVEPRRWTAMPVGTNILGVGYARTSSTIFFDPKFNIEDGESDINSFALSYVRYTGWLGRTSRFEVTLPYAAGKWDGRLDGVNSALDRKGMGDPRLRASISLYGTPALSGKEFAEYRAARTTNTVIGTSISLTVPLGGYCKTCLINVSGNRWKITPQLGVVHTRGPWSFELTASTVFYGDNNDFVEQLNFKQSNLFALQAHAVYSFPSGLWGSLSTAYGVGGKVWIDGTRAAFEVNNWLSAVSIGFPVGRSSSIKVSWLTGRTQNLVGTNSDSLLLSWSTRWSSL